MLQKDCTSKLLGMEHMEITETEVMDTSVTLYVSMEQRTCECPACGALTSKVHDYRTQKVKDIPLQGKTLTWMYKKRRYVCTSCGKRFYEANYLLPKFHRLTNRLCLYTVDRLCENRTRKDIAKESGVSESTVTRWLRLSERGNPSVLPKVLSIDEFRGNADGEKFQAILTDPVHHRIVDILPSCSHYCLYEYLRSFPCRSSVSHFVMDMRKEYADIARSLFPNANIVIDRFHVVRYVCWALENVRKRVQKKLSPDQRKYFKRSRKLLLAHMDKLNDENKAAVERMLLLDRDLREAYLLKEKFYEFMASSSSQEARELLRQFRLFAAVSDIPEFEPVLTMLKNWEPYILNSFDCPYSNGFTEGCNNRIKALKRTAFGYRSFDLFRARILNSFNAKGS